MLSIWSAADSTFSSATGNLNYAPEYTWESYYNARLFKGFFATLTAQHIDNPAYNHDRGPLWAYSLRLHIGIRQKVTNELE